MDSKRDNEQNTEIQKEPWTSIDGPNHNYNGDSKPRTHRNDQQKQRHHRR